MLRLPIHPIPALTRGLRHTASIAFLLALLLAAAPSQAKTGFSEEQLEVFRHALSQRLVAFWQHGRLGTGFQIQDTVDRFIEKLRAGEDSEQVEKWLGERIEASFFSFAKVAAKHDPEAVYQLPFDKGTPRKLLRSATDRPRRGAIPSSYDFGMPGGTPVLAARNGQVMRVVHGYTRGGNSPRFRGEANAIVILHKDGTFATYRHLSPEGLIERGARVKAGTRIGYSGQTGDAPRPMLQFAVGAMAKKNQAGSFPVPFVDSRGKSMDLVKGRKYPNKTGSAGARMDDLLKGSGLP